MRILLVTPQTYPPQSAGGSLSSTHELSLLFAERGHDVAVACGFDARDFLGYWIRLRRKVHPRHRFVKDRLMGYPTYRGWDALDHLQEVIKRFQPDVAIAQAGHTILATERLVQQGVPTLAYIRDVAFGQMGAPPFQSPLIRYVGNSRFTAAAFERAFGWTPSVVPPIVVPERYKAGGKGHAVLHINPFPQKGIDITLDLATRRPDIPFIIIESWTINRTIAENYYATARRLPNVEWKKSVSDMSKIYAQARVVIAPSRYHEGWGRIATEAQVSGIPVLASARGGLPEAVGPGGLLVDPDAPIEAWEKSLAQVWDDPTAYAAFREAALEHSRRREIQKDHLIAALERELLQLTGTSTP